MAYEEALADRVRGAVAQHQGLSERRMFGGLCLMLKGNMFAGVMGDELMLRVGKARFSELLARPGARPMDFTGKPMDGYLYVSPEAIASDADLTEWLDCALQFAGSLPAKQPGAKKTRARKTV